jgi:ribonucleoside-diphosphate reductase alpha chain
VRGNEFNFDRFGEVVQVVSKALMNMNKVGFYPFPEMKEAMDKYNAFGVGIMGFADALIKLGVYYDSNESLDFIDRIGEVYKSSTNAIGGEAFYKRIIAPTGSLSILADCSSGIEPVFAEVFERHLTIGVIEETRDLYKSSYTRTADKISPEWHVKVQAQWQKWADGGISKTVNLPHNATVDDVKNAYKLAWKLGCKGVTIYRDYSKDSQVLYKRPSCSDETCYL